MVYNVRTFVCTKGTLMLKEKENKTSRLDLRIKPSSKDKINVLRSLYGSMSQSELIEQLIDKSYAEHQKSGKIENRSEYVD